MTRAQPYDYYYGNEADQYTFYRLPKALFTNARYKDISDGAKILYGLMLDRMSLSVKNGWLDDEDRVYIVFTLEDAQEYMNCKHDKAVKLFAELGMDKGVGLIERIRQGQGKPAIIYVRKFYDVAEVLTSEKPKSALLENRNLDFGKTEGSNTYLNDTDLSNTDHQSIYPARYDLAPLHDSMDGIDRTTTTDEYRDMIKDNIAYDALCVNYGAEYLSEILEMIVEAVISRRKTIRVGGEDLSAEAVKKRFLELRQDHIEYVIYCVKENATKVRNIKAYLTAALYNAPTTINHYYQAEVSYRLRGGG